jgi:hypothetical protein
MSQGLYLGKEVDPKTGALGARLELAASDLLTHGLIVGMTGSGKTGLAIVLIEEALRAGVPVLAVDPKGDLGNLLLLFEDLAPASFAPWIDPQAARREGKSVSDAAAEAAEAWKKGLAEWGLSGADIASLERARDAVIYTPGSSAGVPLNVLQSLEAPAFPFESAEEDLRDEIAGIVAGLLGLLRIDADPLASREHILLSRLIETAWREGRGLTLEDLIPQIADPPFDKVGALPLESVFPRKDRQGFMVALNNLLASSGFEAWREGDPLDIETFLGAGSGRPRLTIVSTAHLSDEERIFVTALLLDKVKTWMRRQGGTTELRALVYMDEIYGYFPPHPANPPTKRPLLTLLKQARAQGVGVVLATQNPVDLDYKGLANMGTWLVGKLQTRQDRARLEEGLTGAGVEAESVDRLLDATRKRVFLLHDVHRKGPSLVHSRWSLSYLRGPLTREDVGRLMAGRAQSRVERQGARSASAGAPVLPAPLEHSYHSVAGGERGLPHLLVKYAVNYKGAGETVGLRAYPMLQGAVGELLESEPLAVEEASISTLPPEGLGYGELPEYMGPAGAAKTLERVLKERLADKLDATFWFDPISQRYSHPGEDAEAFAVRLRAAGPSPEEDRLRERLEKKKRELEAAERELSGRKTETWGAVATAVLHNIGLFMGGRRRSVSVSGVGSVLSKNRMENAAEARAEELRAEVAELDRQLTAHMTGDASRFEERAISPSRADVKVLRLGVLWVY